MSIHDGSQSHLRQTLTMMVCGMSAKSGSVVSEGSSCGGKNGKKWKCNFLHLASAAARLVLVSLSCQCGTAKYAR